MPTPIGAIPGLFIGEIRPFGFGHSGVLPDSLREAGWLECNGQELNNRDYDPLHQTIGDGWGSSTPGTTFRVPDLRGLFLRGWDQGGVRDPDYSSRGSLQPNGTQGNSVGSYQTDLVGGHHHDSGVRLHDSFPEGDSGGGSHLGRTSDTQNFSTGSAGGAETRPKNVYVMYCIYTGMKP